MTRLIRKLLSAERGATAIEYGLIVAMIVIVIVASIGVLGGNTSSMWGNMTTKVAAAEPF